MALEQARTYLERVVPWQQGAHVNLHWTVPNRKFNPSLPEGKGNKRYFLNGRAFTTSQEAIDQLTFLVGGRSNAKDIYACMSAQTLAEAKVVGGRQFLEAKRGTDNVAGLKALYIDLDVKAVPKEGEKAYPTSAIAFGEMRRFIAEVGLPRPTLAVSSGTGGAHLYWVIDHVLPRDEWQPLANALAEATRRHGLTIDTQCTVDSARILRVPETWNHKGTPPLPVVLGRHIEPSDVPLDDMRRILLPYMGAQVVRLPTAMTGGLPGKGPVSELAAGIQAPAAPPVDIDSIKPLCGFVQTAMDTGGQGYAQPLWNLTTLLATFTQSARGDGRWAAHEMAKGHPGYAQADTDALYDRKVSERDARNIGWPSCAAVQNAGCSSCATCPLQHLNKSPLSFGTPVSAQPPLAANANPAPSANPAPGGSPLPVPYVYRPNGLIAKAVVQQDNTIKLVDVCAYPIYLPWLQMDPCVLHFKATLGLMKRDISIPGGDIKSQKFGKLMGDQGFVFDKVQGLLLQDFLVAWIQHLQATRDAVVSSSPFGWAVLDSKIDGFVYANRTWTDALDKPAASPSPVLADHYTPHGSVEPWKEAARFITSQRRPALDMILAVSFGAPLMRFTGQSGAIVSAYSVRSGIGKSTAMEVSQAVWGHPKKAMNALNDTQNSVINKAGQLRSLPLFWDELKGEEQKEAFVKLAFQISGGKEKSRLNSDATQRDPGTWQTIVQAASNDSLMDTVQRRVTGSDAGAMRLFEYEVPAAISAIPVHHGIVARLVARCHDNYGQAGLQYAKFLGAQHKRCAAEVAKLQDALTARLQAPNEERFWIAAMTCCIMGARYANEIGLTQIDVQALTLFCVETLKGMRTHNVSSSTNITRSESVESILADFLSDMAAKHTLTTDILPTGRGRPDECTIKNTDVNRLDTVYVRHAADENVYVIRQKELFNWLEKRGYAPSTYMKALDANYPGMVEKAQRNLAAGTRISASNFKTYVIVLKYAGTGLKTAA